MLNKENYENNYVKNLVALKIGLISFMQMLFLFFWLWGGIWLKNEIHSEVEGIHLSSSFKTLRPDFP